MARAKSGSMDTMSMVNPGAAAIDIGSTTGRRHSYLGGGGISPLAFETKMA